MLYGEILIGPPGSGKSTYLLYKKDVLKERDVITVNLDPGNNKKGFDYDIKQIASTRDRMKKCDIGPNYSVKLILHEFLENFDTGFSEFIENEISKRNKEGDKTDMLYFIFDFPGQIEFFVSDDVLRNFTRKLQKKFGFSLVCVNLVDINFFLEKKTLLYSYLTCTIAMVLLELPHITVLSKCDNYKKLKKISEKNMIMSLDDIAHVQNILNEDTEKEHPLYKSMVEIVENESLLSFDILDYDHPDAMMYLQLIIDKASGYFYNEEPVYEIVDREKIFEYYE